MTNLQEIAEWFDIGKNQAATHLIVVRDTFDYDDYPIYAFNDGEALQKYDEHNDKDMQSIMEVYDLRKAKGPQINTPHRCMNLPPRSKT